MKDANRNITAIFTGDSSCKQHEKELISQLVQLCLNCLVYDFIGNGSSSDDTTDDMSTVQIPTTWRSGKKKIKLIFKSQIFFPNN